MPCAGSSSIPAIRACGSPPGLRTVRTTDAGSTSRKPAVAGRRPGWASNARATSGLLKSCPARTIPPSRQSPGRGRDRVVEGVAPVLELEVRAVGRRSSRRVDPDAGRPAAARAHDREVQVAVGLDVEARHAPVDDRDGVVLGRPGRTVQLRRLIDGDDAVLEVGDERVQRRGHVVGVDTGDDEHGQVARATQVGDGFRAALGVAVLRDPQPRPAVAGQLAVELGPIAGVGGVEHGRDEAVVVGAPDRQPDVGQVGVDVQHAIAMAVVAGHRRGDALAHERDDELANGIVLARIVGHDDLGDADRASRPRVGHGRARRPERDARGRAEGEPVVGGMVERERDLGDVRRSGGRTAGR